MSTEIVLGIPHPHYFFPSGVPSTYTLIGPDYQISRAAELGTPQADATNGGYLVTITPRDLGRYTLIVKASGGSSVHVHEFESVRATEKETTLGVGISHHALVPYYAPLTMGAVNTIIRNGGATATISYASKGKQVVPMDGYIYGVSVYVYSDSDYPSLTSIRFATVDPATGRVRGVSENFKAQMVTDNAWNDAIFAKPVLGKAGDWIVLEISDVGLTNAYSVGVNNAAATLTEIQKIEYTPNALDLSGVNTFGTAWGALAFNIKPLIAPPHIAIGGHSVWSGYPISASCYDLTNRPYARETDIAALLGDRLGLRVMNISVSSQNMSSYVLDGQFFDQFVDEIFPSVLLFDTVASDYTVTTEDDYLLMLDKLMAQCVKYKIELVMIEGAPMGSNITTDPPRIEGMRERRTIIHTWCRNHGIPCIPMEWLLGMRDGHPYHRDTQKVLTNPTVDYTLVGDGKVHLSASGLIAVVQGLANCFKPRRHMQPIQRAEYRELDEVRLAAETAASAAQS